jgi:NAD(P)-dependent dehydrogenase (short-subunit alcohol dehydrogenase family)
MRDRRRLAMSRIAVITGTTHGIGVVTSRELAEAGCTVVMLCRNDKAAAKVRADIVARSPGADVHAIHCDLASLASVRESARVVRRDFERIDLLINNAGIVSTRHRMSEDGFELTFATNYLGPFLLTQLLLDRVTEHGRIINVSSRIHYKGRLGATELAQVADRRARYSAGVAYARSKLANVIHTLALARRLEGTRIAANCLHPGVVDTNLLPRWLRLLRPLRSREIIDAELGARTTLHLALSAEVAGKSGRYFDENHREQPPLEAANDVTLQEALWQASERWVA